MSGVLNPIEGGSQYIHRNWGSTEFLSLSWHTLSRPSCLHRSAHRSWEVRKQRGLRVKGLNCKSRSGGNLFM